MEYQRIFIPVDSSRASGMALEEAIKLARMMGASLCIAHSIELPVYGPGNPELLDSAAMEQPLADAGNAILQAASAKAREQGIKTEEMLLENHGDPIAGVLLDAALRARAQLIVMGTHGRTGILHLLLGSVAEGVLREASVPVMLIRSP